MKRRLARRNQGKADPGPFAARFRRLSLRIGLRSHGLAPYPTLLQVLFGDLSKDQRLGFVPRLFQAPVTWEDAA